MAMETTPGISNSWGHGTSWGTGSSGVQPNPATLGNIQGLYPGLVGRIGQLLDPRNLASLNEYVTGGRPVYTPDQIQNQVNQTSARNFQGAGADQKAMADRFAGSGYGANSPQALSSQIGAMQQARGQNVSAENDLRFNAARANADMALQQRQLTAGYAMGTLSPLLQAVLQIGQPWPFSKNQSNSQNDSGSSSIGPSTYNS